MSIRYELLPFGAALEQAAAAPAPLTLTVTCSPKHGIDATVDMAEQLADLGHRAVPHVAARQLRDAAHLDAILERCAAAGVDDLVVVGGDSPEPLGPFQSADALLPVLNAHRHRPARIGIGGYPEGHPSIPESVLRESLVRKATRADYVITQMCFDSGTLLNWVASARADGITLPIYAGLPGQVDRRRLAEIATRVGVGQSLKRLRGQRGLTRFLRQPSHIADRLLDGLSDPDGAVVEQLAGIQYYTFNRLLDTLSWETRQNRPSELSVPQVEHA
jgi:methylenetetrahydrofolate reductase (NADPH)